MDSITLILFFIFTLIESCQCSVDPLAIICFWCYFRTTFRCPPCIYRLYKKRTSITRWWRLVASYLYWLYWKESVGWLANSNKYSLSIQDNRQDKTTLNTQNTSVIISSIELKSWLPLSCDLSIWIIDNTLFWFQDRHVPNSFGSVVNTIAKSNLSNIQNETKEIDHTYCYTFHCLAAAFNFGSPIKILYTACCWHSLKFGSGRKLYFTFKSGHSMYLCSLLVVYDILSQLCLRNTHFNSYIRA